MLGIFSCSRKVRRVRRFFREQKTGVCSVRFSGADFAAAVLLLSRNFIQPIFPASRETDLCGGSKREFFEDSFRVRTSSICLDLRLDLPIILFTIIG